MRLRGRLREKLVFILISLLVLGGGFYAYGMLKTAKAGRLLQTAAQVRTANDARALIAAWKGSVDRYEEHPSPDGSRKAYQLEFSNGIIGWTKIFASTGITVQVIMTPDELDEVLIAMYSADSSVWAQEEFYSRDAKAFRLNIEKNDAGTPLKAVIMFGSELPFDVRRQSFGFEQNCFFRYGGCKYASEMLPNLQKLVEIPQTEMTW